MINDNKILKLDMLGSKIHANTAEQGKFLRNQPLHLKKVCVTLNDLRQTHSQF